MQMRTHSYWRSTGIRKGLGHVGGGVDTTLGVLSVFELVSFVLCLGKRVDGYSEWVRTEEQPRSASQSP